ncbi:MAG: crotonase/enoyl-CoA hydratase family protein [Pseudomonadota bacterium]|nr:crotonase/enoyl-CoA hydratase family protein [Pseudomonadota bacterium]
MNAMNALVLQSPEMPAEEYAQLKTYYDEKSQSMWYHLDPKPRPCVTWQLLNDLKQFHRDLRSAIDHPGGPAIKYLILGSNSSEVFNLGGDLKLFKELIEKRDRGALFEYGKACIDTMYPHHIELERDLTSITLLQGDALGGGLEAALSSSVIIAEKGIKMGFPEILFNLFPGMGAYSFLSRKLNARMAKEIILSGKLYQAEEFYEMGLIDVLVEKGEGQRAVYDYIRKENRSRNGITALRAAARRVEQVAYDELIDIVDIWVDAALKLERKDLRMMERLVARQAKSTLKATA